MICQVYSVAHVEECCSVWQARHDQILVTHSYIYLLPCLSVYIYGMYCMYYCVL